MRQAWRAALAGVGCLLLVSTAACGASSSAPRASASTTTWHLASLGDARTLALSGISCPTVDECVAVGLSSSHSGVVLSTSDGGTTWTSHHLASSGPSKTGSGFRIVSLNAVSCASRNDCWVAGATSANAGVVLATTDGGKKWHPQFESTQLQNPASAGLYALNGISCPTTRECWAVGSTSSGSGAVVATSDAGRTWQAQPLPVGIGGLNSVSCPTSSQCSAGGTNALRAGTVVTTADRGALWSAETLPDVVRQALPSGHYGINGVACASSAGCVVAGSTSSSSGVVLSTADNGTTWSAPTIPRSAGLLNAVSCPTKSSCVAVGATSSRAGLGITTSDGGTGWTAQALPAGLGILYGISCPTTSSCWVVGATTSGRGVVLTTGTAT